MIFLQRSENIQTLAVTEMPLFHALNRFLNPPKKDRLLNAWFSGSSHWRECSELALSPAQQTSMQSAAKVQFPPFM